MLEHEGAVGQLVERRGVEAALSRLRIDSLSVQLLVHRVGSALARMELRPDRHEAVVVGAAAERARPVAGGEGCRLVEEEELGEAAGLHQRLRAASRGTRAGTRSSA